MTPLRKDAEGRLIHADDAVSTTSILTGIPLRLRLMRLAANNRAVYAGMFYSAMDRALFPKLQLEITVIVSSAGRSTRYRLLNRETGETVK